MPRKVVRIDGLRPEDILALSQDELEGLVFCGHPVVFTAGTAEILGEFRLSPGLLVLELAHIDGGGEGVLPRIWTLADRYARSRGLTAVEWIVHAAHCARPNLKLRRVLQRKGFTVEKLPGIGEIYHLVIDLKDPRTESM